MTRLFIDCVDNYEFLEPISEGQFSTVFKAKKKINQKIVAIKKITKKITKYGIEKLFCLFDLFQNIEAERYLVRLDGYFIYDDKLHLIMPFYEKGSLQDYIRGPHLTSESIVCILKHLVHGLQFLYKKGFVYPDLKPCNVLIAAVECGKIHVVIDYFKLNRSMKTITRTTSFKNPDLCRGKEYGPKVDIYALGAVFYSMLTNSNPPNKRKKILQTADQIVKDSVACELLKEMLKDKNPISLEGIFEHKYVKEKCAHVKLFGGRCMECAESQRAEMKSEKKDAKKKS
uniref:Protein kinase domain-containing protein n=1 Tax=Panagrolaimus sp. JU765 TaxID=591449 RepID=A0AC34PXG8_9BILA